MTRNLVRGLEYVGRVLFPFADRWLVHQHVDDETELHEIRRDLRTLLLAELSAIMGIATVKICDLVPSLEERPGTCTVSNSLGVFMVAISAVNLAGLIFKSCKNR